MTTTKSHSYKVREQIQPGSYATVTSAETPRTTNYLGQRVRVLDYSNAGFSGIVAWVEADDGEQFNIGAGHLSK